MKKLFAIVAVMGVLTFGSTQLAQAQDAPAAEQTEQAAVAPAADAAAPAAMEAAEGGIHKELKPKGDTACRWGTGHGQDLGCVGRQLPLL